LGHCRVTSNGKGKADPLEAWSGPEGPRKLRFPYFMTTAQVRLSAPRKWSWYSFLLEAVDPRAISEGFYVNEKFH